MKSILLSLITLIGFSAMAETGEPEAVCESVGVGQTQAAAEVVLTLHNTRTNPYAYHNVVRVDGVEIAIRYSPKATENDSPFGKLTLSTSSGKATVSATAVDEHAGAVLTVRDNSNYGNSVVVKCRIARTVTTNKVGMADVREQNYKM